MVYFKLNPYNNLHCLNAYAIRIFSRDVYDLQNREQKQKHPMNDIIILINT